MVNHIHNRLGTPVESINDDQALGIGAFIGAEIRFHEFFIEYQNINDVRWRRR